MGFNLVPYKSPDAGATPLTGQPVSSGQSPSPFPLLSAFTTVVLVSFAWLGAMVTMSEGLQASPLLKWFPWLGTTVGFILAFMIPVCMVICVLHVVIWAGTRLLRLSTGKLQVLTLGVLVMIIPLVGWAGGYIGYVMSGDSSVSGGDRLTVACPGEKLLFLGKGAHKDQRHVLPSTDVFVDFKIKNVGAVEWRNRYLQRWGQHDDSTQLKSEARIPIHMIPRGKETQVRVRLSTPRIADTYTAYFKVVNERGEFCYPTSEPLQAKFTVVEQRDLQRLSPQ